MSSRGRDRRPTQAQLDWLSEHDYETVEHSGAAHGYRSRGGHERAWLEDTRGRTVVAQMRRYLQTRDSARIERALYDYLMQRCGFIAHYGLGPADGGPGDGGFRYEYREPMTLIEEFAHSRRHWWKLGPEITVTELEGCGWFLGDTHLYADGLTCTDVTVQVIRLMYEHLDRLVAARDTTDYERDVTTLIALARRHHMTIVPAGFVLTAPTLAPPPSREADNSLVAELRRLAGEHGHDLAEPRAQLALA